jgi:hypothetical protein
MPLSDVFWSMLWFFLFVAWITVVITVIADILLNGELSVVARALWALLVILVPWLGVLTYVVAYGSTMGDRPHVGIAARDATSSGMYFTQPSRYTARH